MHIYLIDNFDSFTYNLVHLLRDIGVDRVTVERNDVISVEKALAADAVVISPGPGLPQDSGKLLEVMDGVLGKVPVFGVCLGMQAMGHYYGGTLRNLSDVFHGVATAIKVVDQQDIFKGMKTMVEVGRYHSWVVGNEGFPEVLEITAVDGEGEIMALRHKELPVYGVQFHPESVLTPEGHQMLENFIQLVSEKANHEANTEQLI